MTHFIKRLAAAVFAAFAFALPASATTYSTDFTDLWWAGEAESGWGINFIQQHEVIFATMFVYGTDNTPRWYVASNLSPSSNGSTTFVGALFRTTGPYFGAPWTGGVTNPQVGIMSVAFNSPTTATLTYNVEGVSVTKQITRQTWRNNNIAGNYLGGITAIGNQCADSRNNGQPILIFGVLRVAQTGMALTMRIEFNLPSTGQPAVCTITGTMTQSGKLGALANAPWACTYTSTGGTVNITAIDVTKNGFNADFTGSDQFCSAYSGRFGGLRDVL